MSSTSIENCYQYAGAESNELSMVFSFHHLKVDFMGNEKWVLVPFDFQKLKNIIFEWQTKMSQHNAWNAVFWCNHDQPRVVSRFGNTEKYWKESAKMLATVVHCLRGTPYIYQGEEIGMTNAGFTDISQYKDVESINHFRILQEKGLTEDNAYSILQVHSRDNSRTPMQWNNGENAGFTSGTPWIEVIKNYKDINAESQIDDENSVFAYYKKLVKLRKDEDAISYGDFQSMAENHKEIFAYKRQYNGETIIVVNNFYGKEILWDTEIDLSGYKCILSNYNDSKVDRVLKLRPYESIVLKK